MAGRGTRGSRPVKTLTSPFSDEELAVYAAFRRNRKADIDWTSCAVLVVDVTQAFLGPRLPTLAASKQLRTACGLPGWEALPWIAELLAAGRSARRPIIFTKPDWQVESHLGGTTVGDWPTRPKEEDRIPQAIAPLARELVLMKPRTSAFFATYLQAYLIRKRVHTVVVGGSTTSGCVRATVVDGMSFGFDMVIASDACFDRSPTSHAVSLFELEAKYAEVMRTRTICEHVRRIS